ncbi:MAG: cupin domain-containing protein [Atopobiaceae bacterium]|nr:cupin domain-containing protein [Atopobiaceae bacterium]
MTGGYMEFIGKREVAELANPGVVSRQLLSPKNSTSRRVTITEVHLEPGASQPRHTHEASEQIWYALSGEGTLLLAEGQERPFFAGDVVRFEDGDVHGLCNTGNGEFVYLSVTAPPIDFGYAYQSVQQHAATADNRENVFEFHDDAPSS